MKTKYHELSKDEDKEHQHLKSELSSAIKAYLSMSIHLARENRTWGDKLQRVNQRKGINFHESGTVVALPLKQGRWDDLLKRQAVTMFSEIAQATTNRDELRIGAKSVTDSFEETIQKIFQLPSN